MTEKRYGWQIVSNPTAGGRIVAIVDGSIEDAQVYVEDDDHLAVGSQVALIDGDTVENDQ